MENIINKLGHSRLLEYFLIMWIVTLVAIKLIDRSMYYILVLTEKQKNWKKIQWFCLWLYHNIKIWIIMLFLIVFYIMFKKDLVDL
jgi:hypothetical protein